MSLSSGAPLSVQKFNRQVVFTLAYREIMKLKSEPARVIGMVMQPLLVWLVFSFGFDAGFTGVAQTAATGGDSFLEYFFPGMVVMTLLFGCIFSSMTVIDDKSGGFLQAALVTPASRYAVIFGKVLGVILLTFIQTLLLVLVAWFFVEGSENWNWLLLLFWFVASCVALVPLNLAVALWLDSSQSYHAFMGGILLPAWALSGAVFPLDHGLVRIVAMLNPMSYMVEGFRSGFALQENESVFLSGALPGLALLVLGFAGIKLAVMSLNISAGRR